MSDRPIVSIVLPCYNPVNGWLENIESNLLQISSKNFATEVVIINDGSSKNFDEVEAKSFFKHRPEVKIIGYPKNKGKGHALRTAIMHIKNDIIIYTDIDFPYTTESFLKICEDLFTGHNDVVIGVRSANYYAHLPKMRVRISKLLRLAIRTFLRIPTDDTQCGLKGFNKKGKEIFLETTIDRYLFDLEFVFLTARKKAVLKTVNVELRPGIELSHMRWSILMQEFGNFLKIFVKAIF